MNRWWILLGTLVAIPVIVCAGLFAAFLIAGNAAENEYERRAQAVVAAALETTGPSPAQLSISEVELNRGFHTLPNVLTINTGNVSFTAQYGWLRARGQGFFGSYLNYAYEPIIASAGGVRLIPASPPGYDTSSDTLGYSHGGVGSAIERGINRALAEAGVRPTAVKARDGMLTIDLEPIA